jgi:hypothetical protein
MTTIGGRDGSGEVTPRAYGGGMIRHARHVSVSIARPVAEVVAYAGDPHPLSLRDMLQG